MESDRPPAQVRRVEPTWQPSATVACLRQQPTGLEVLLVRRHAQLAFHGGAWVFPGGRVDPEDAPDGDRHSEQAARFAATREAREEAALTLSPERLLPLSHWTTPPGRPRRFTTWFYLHDLSHGPTVEVDGSEILAHRWLPPQAALAARDRGELDLPPPTFVTLTWLTRFGTVEEALEAARSQTPTRYVPRPCQSQAGPVSLYEGDAGYADRDPERPGPRHRLWMLESGWRYERTP